MKIILINDGSLNNSEQNIEQFRVDLASGEYIAFLDSDDMLSTEYFEKILNIIEKNNSIDLIEINAYKFQNINGKKIFQIHFFGSEEILLTDDKKISFRSTYEVCMVKSNKKSLFY